MHPFNPHNSRATALVRAICGAAIFSAWLGSPVSAHYGARDAAINTSRAIRIPPFRANLSSPAGATTAIPRPRVGRRSAQKQSYDHARTPVADVCPAKSST